MAIKNVIAMLCVAVMNVAAVILSLSRDGWLFALAYSALAMLSLLALLGTRRVSGIRSTKRKWRLPMLSMNKFLNRMTAGQAFVGDWMVALSIIVSMLLLGRVQFGWKLDAGFLPGGNMVSNFVPYFLVALLYVGFAVHASLTRPRGWKWGLRDLFWSLLPLGCLLVFMVFVKPTTNEEITEYRSICWTIGAAIAFDLIVNILVPLFYHRWGTDAVPAPTVSLSASALTVAAGGEVELTIMSTGAERATIEHVGDVAPDGKVRVTLNATRTFKATVVGERGTSVSSPDVTVTVA